MISKSSTTDDSADRVLVARVRRPFGVRGELFVELISDDPARLDAGAVLLLDPESGSERAVTVETSRPHGAGDMVIRLDGHVSRDDVEHLRRAELYVPRDALPPADDGAYYFHDLVGCACHDESAGELGRVTAVRRDGGGELLEVDDGDRRLLVPFVNAYLRGVDVDRRRIDLALPEGLLDTCASRS